MANSGGEVTRNGEHEATTNGEHEVTTNGEHEVMANGENTIPSNGTGPQSPPRRGIWDWARANTGKLNIIGRLPHPEWKSPSSASKLPGPLLNGAQRPSNLVSPRDDFSLPSTTATEPDNLAQQHRTAAAKLEGLGLGLGISAPALSPLQAPSSASPLDFSQTRGSSDDLIANMSETTGSPSPMLFRHTQWAEREDDASPTGSGEGSGSPGTPTPPHGRSDSIMDLPISKVRRGETNGAQEEMKGLEREQEQEQEQEQNEEEEGKSGAVERGELPDHHHHHRGAASSPSNGPSCTANEGGNGEERESMEGNKQKKQRANDAGAPASPTPIAGRRVPTYKIALAAAFLPQHRVGGGNSNSMSSGGRRSASSSSAAAAAAATTQS